MCANLSNCLKIDYIGTAAFKRPSITCYERCLFSLGLNVIITYDDFFDGTINFNVHYFNSVQAGKLRWKPDKNLVQIKWLHTTSSGASCSESETDPDLTEDNNCDDLPSQPPVFIEELEKIHQNPTELPPELPPKMRSLQLLPASSSNSCPATDSCSQQQLFSSMGARAFSEDNDDSEISEEIEVKVIDSLKQLSNSCESDSADNSCHNGRYSSNKPPSSRTSDSSRSSDNEGSLGPTSSQRSLSKKTKILISKNGDSTVNSDSHYRPSGQARLGQARPKATQSLAEPKPVKDTRDRTSNSLSESIYASKDTTKAVDFTSRRSNSLMSMKNGQPAGSRQFSASTHSSRLRRSNSLTRTSSVKSDSKTGQQARPSNNTGMDTAPKIVLDKVKKAPLQSSQHPNTRYALNVPAQKAPNFGSSRPGVAPAGLGARPFQRKTSRNSLSSNSSVSSQTTEESSGLGSTTLPSMTSSCSSASGAAPGRRRASAAGGGAGQAAPGAGPGQDNAYSQWKMRKREEKRLNERRAYLESQLRRH